MNSELSQPKNSLFTDKKPGITYHNTGNLPLLINGAWNGSGHFFVNETPIPGGIRTLMIPIGASYRLELHDGKLIAWHEQELKLPYGEFVGEEDFGWSEIK